MGGPGGGGRGGASTASEKHGRAAAIFKRLRRPNRFVGAVDGGEWVGECFFVHRGYSGSKLWGCMRSVQLSSECVESMENTLLRFFVTVAWGIGKQCNKEERT